MLEVNLEHDIAVFLGHNMSNKKYLLNHDNKDSKIHQNIKSNTTEISSPEVVGSKRKLKSRFNVNRNGYDVVWSTDNQLTIEDDKNGIIQEKLNKSQNIVKSILNFYNIGGITSDSLKNIFTPDVYFSFVYMGNIHPMKKANDHDSIPLKFNGTDGIHNLIMLLSSCMPDLVFDITNIVVMEDGKLIKTSVKFSGTKVCNLIFPPSENDPNIAQHVELDTHVEHSHSMIHLIGLFLLKIDQNGKVYSHHFEFTENGKS
eukprot:TRINITY_DN68169_c1_g1_i1.p1 TRINITY_DN68169_c1_g1~~TRINITY_DN68169_c1_g1_i1.p1  ORF type:complete len:258 (+),score=-26.97 TRINITY_DN68169_c1_g1_i1:53-826(+)